MENNEKSFTLAVPSRHNTARCADALFSSENIRANSLNTSNCEEGGEERLLNGRVC
jgi:hypothetical protein